MLIASRLRLNSLISLLSLLVMIVLSVWTLRFYHQALEDNALADEILTTIFEQTALLSEFLLYDEARPLAQWTESKEHLARLLTLAATQFKGNDEKALLIEMQKKFVVSSNLLTRTLKVKEEIKNNPDLISLEQRLVGQQIFNASALYVDTNRLKDLTIK